MFSKIRSMWLKISEKNRKRIVSSVNTFIWVSVSGFATALHSDQVMSWTLLGLIGRQATKETLDMLLADRG
jgi:hypothetical protein